MLNDEFFVSCLFRLGMHFPFIPPNLRCICKGKYLINEFGDHIHCCNCKGMRLKKHNAVVKVIIAMCAKAGIYTIDEPLACFPNNIEGLKPDIRLVQPNFIINNKHKNNNTCNNCPHDIVTDFTITHPGNDTSINKHHSDTTLGASALGAEQYKCGKYNSAAKNNNLHFVPLAAETYGVLGKRFVKFIYDVVRKSHEFNSTMPFSIKMEYWIKRISVKLQVMNARMFMSRVKDIVSGKSLGLDEARNDSAIWDCRARVHYGA